MPKSIQDWLAEGEQLYTDALSDLSSLEQELADIQARLASKQAEVNKLASVIGKPPVGTPPPASPPSTNGHAATAHNVTVVGPSPTDHPSSHASHSIPNSPATIARALTGKGLSGR